MLLPPLEIVIDDEELSSLRENKNFLYLIKSAYEHVFSK